MGTECSWPAGFSPARDDLGTGLITPMHSALAYLLPAEFKKLVQGANNTY